MTAVNHIATIGFFWSYIVIVVFIMYNMVVANILVVFQEQNEKRRLLKLGVISALMENMAVSKASKDDSDTEMVFRRNVSQYMKDRNV